jgi:hypothetical protein
MRTGLGCKENPAKHGGFHVNNGKPKPASCFSLPSGNVVAAWFAYCMGCTFPEYFLRKRDFNLCGSSQKLIATITYLHHSREMPVRSSPSVKEGVDYSLAAA